jgi:glycosyltransferase involved in cell wall biosynthesis
MSARSDAEAPLLTVVVPVHNEEESLPELHSRLVDSVGAGDGRLEIVYVDDGSTDRSGELIHGWMDDPRVDVVLVRLSRNFGMDVAMSAGLDHSRGAYVALMHADLQDPPELLAEMLARAREGADVVYARRIGRDESAVKRMLATTFYALMRRIARVPYQGQAGDFRVLSRRVVEAIQRMPERRRFLRGMVAWVGYEQVPVEYRRAGRHHGRGASYMDLLRLALEAMTAFSDVPLQLATLFGTVTALLSALGAVVIAVLSLTGIVDFSVWVWVLVAVLFLSGVQLITTGILGRYLARVHGEVLRRPLYLVESVERSRSDLPASPEPARSR